MLKGSRVARTLSHTDHAGRQVNSVQILYERCAGIDVHKDQVTVAVRTPGEGPRGRQTQVRKFRAFYGVLAEMARWLVSLRVTHVTMEATGIYTMPVYHALLEHGRFSQVLVCNAAHVKNVPGRKTDAVDAGWLAELLECGGAAGQFRARAEDQSGAGRRPVGQETCRCTHLRAATPRWSAAGRRDRAGLGGLLDRHRVRAVDDRSPH